MADRKAYSKNVPYAPSEITGSINQVINCARKVVERRNDVAWDAYVNDLPALLSDLAVAIKNMEQVAEEYGFLHHDRRSGGTKR